MATGNFVAYYRVSTALQGRSGLGLEAQQAAVRTWLDGGRWSLIGEFTEIESGKTADRPQLAAAFEQCRLTGAKLVIAKLDRLSRNVHFLSGLKDAGIDFVCADNPHATRFTVHILAAVAEFEREQISTRTKDALAAAKARGKALGGWRPTRRDGSPRKPLDGRVRALEASRRYLEEFDARVLPLVTEMRERGMSLNAIARELTEKHVATRRGGAWTATSVRKMLARA